MQRIHGLDLFRGIFLLIMTFDHLTSPMGFLRRFNWVSGNYTYNPFGYASAAEGFVLLSGIVAGLVFTKKLNTWGFDGISKKLRQRAWQIYKVTFLSCILLGLGAYIFRENASEWQGYLNLYPFVLNPVKMTALSSTLLFLPSYIEILPMYCWFLLATPIILKSFRKEYGLLVLAISFLSWIFGQYAPFKNMSIELSIFLTDLLGVKVPIHLGWFDIFSWQLLYVSGLFIGYSKFTCARWIEYIFEKKTILFSVLLIALLSFGIRHSLITPKFHWEFPAIATPTLGWFRLLSVFAQLYLFSFLLSKFPLLSRCRPIEFLGKHSLEVCAFQAVGCHLLLIAAYSNIKDFHSIALGMLLLAAMISLYIPAFYSDFKKSRNGQFPGWKILFPNSADNLRTQNN